MLVDILCLQPVFVVPVIGRNYRGLWSGLAEELTMFNWEGLQNRY